MASAPFADGATVCDSLSASSESEIDDEEVSRLLLEIEDMSLRAASDESGDERPSVLRAKGKGANPSLPPSVEGNGASAGDGGTCAAAGAATGANGYDTHTRRLLRRPKMDPPRGHVHANGATRDDRFSRTNSSGVLSVSAPCFINALPAELLVDIFARLDVVELSRTVAPVCRLWRDISRDGSARRNFQIDRCRLGGHHVRPTVLIGVLATCPLLVELNLACYFAVSDELVDIVSATCPNLRVVDISFASVTADAVRSLTQHCKRLTSLNVEGCSSLSAEALRDVAQLPYLRDLNLSHCVRLPEEMLAGFLATRGDHSRCVTGPPPLPGRRASGETTPHTDLLASMFPPGRRLSDAQFGAEDDAWTGEGESTRPMWQRMLRLPSAGLVSLNLDGIENVGDDTVSLIACGSHATLRHLALDGAGLSDAALVAIANKVPKLRTLSVSFCESMTDAAVEAIGAKLRCLRVLRLRKGAFSTEALVSMFLSVGAALVHIDVSECHTMGDAAVVAIGGTCHKLRRLKLAWCWLVTDHGIAALGECTGMEALDVCGCHKVTDQSLAFLGRSMTHIRYLNIKQCNAAGLSAPFSALIPVPGLTLIDYYDVPHFIDSARPPRKQQSEADAEADSSEAKSSASRALAAAKSRRKEVSARARTTSTGSNSAGRRSSATESGSDIESSDDSEDWSGATVESESGRLRVSVGVVGAVESPFEKLWALRWN